MSIRMHLEKKTFADKDKDFFPDQIGYLYF